MDLLRFITAGSVDDGKSTLIGRLLYDSKNILIDQLEALEKSTKNKENGEVDLALLTDGLRAEREQGITIDVAFFINTANNFTCIPAIIMVIIRLWPNNKLHLESCIGQIDIAV